MRNEQQLSAPPSETGEQEIQPQTRLEFVSSNPPPPDPRFTKSFIDEKELLRRIPISRRTAFSWMQSGKIPCVKINRRKLFHWASVEAALLRLQRGGVE